MRQSEHILYITLIDFLLQLLFLGMVISVVYAISTADTSNTMDPEECKSAIDFTNTAKRLTGISNLTELTDKLTALGPLNSASNDAEVCRDIAGKVKAVGGAANAKKILDKAILETGQGLPSCLPNKAKIMSFDAYHDHITLRDYNPNEFHAFLQKTNINKTAIERLSPTEFRSMFSKVREYYPECRFNVDLIEHSFDTRPRDAVRSAFMVFPKAAPDRK